MQDNAMYAGRVACSKQAMERAATCPPITITRIPVILHTRIIGCHSWSPFPSRVPVRVLSLKLELARSALKPTHLASLGKLPEIYLLANELV